jgi:hypothetical protein
MDTPAILEQALQRADIETLAARGGPAHLRDCQLAEVDLAGLDLSDWQFERCDLRHTNFTGARLERTRWQSCRGPSQALSGPIWPMRALPPAISTMRVFAKPR